MDCYYNLKMVNGNTVLVKGASELAVESGDQCVFRRDFFDDIGTILRCLPNGAPEGTCVETLPVIDHKVTDDELEKAAENSTLEPMAMDTASSLISSLGLEMKLLNAHYSLDGKMVYFQFSAEGRVDFRELVKELSRALSARIELRQIGVRDETAIYGGIGVCGQPLCCCRFLKEFDSINVRMAKEQGLSLTPSTISGACGRLKCCLKYEHEVYRDLEKDMPRRGEWCETPQGRGRISDRNLLSRKVNVTLESGQEAIFPVADIVPGPAPRNHNENHSGRRNEDKRVRNRAPETEK